MSRHQPPVRFAPIIPVNECKFIVLLYYINRVMSDLVKIVRRRVHIFRKYVTFAVTPCVGVLIEIVGSEFLHLSFVSLPS